jgi:hypothetical protein
MKNKWSNVSTNPQAIVLCIGANGTLVRAVRRIAVQDYSQGTFLPLQSVLYPFLIYLSNTAVHSEGHRFESWPGDWAQ